MEDDTEEHVAVKDSLKSLVGLFECTICYNLLTRPSQTQCGHIFCSTCIKSITMLEKGEAKCPNCRRKLNRRAVRPRDDIAELNLAVRYLEETLMRELVKKKKDHDSSSECSEEDDEVVEKKNLTDNHSPVQVPVSGVTVMVEVEDKSNHPASVDVCPEDNKNDSQSPELVKVQDRNDKNPCHSPALNVDADVEKNDHPSTSSGCDLVDAQVDDAHQSPAAVDNFNFPDLEEIDDVNDISRVTSQLSQLPALTQSQPLDLSMLHISMNQVPLEETVNKCAMKFVEPLDLSTTKKRPREIITELYQQPENCRRRNPVFLQEERESGKRQKLQDDFKGRSTNNYRHTPKIPRTSPAPVESSVTRLETAPANQVKESRNDHIDEIEMEVEQVLETKESLSKEENQLPDEMEKKEMEVEQVLENEECFSKDNEQELPDEIGIDKTENHSEEPLPVLPLPPVPPPTVRESASTPSPEPATSQRSIIDVEVEKDSKKLDNDEIDEIEVGREQVLESDEEPWPCSPQQKSQPQDTGSHRMENNSHPFVRATSTTPAPVSSGGGIDIVKESSSETDFESDDDEDQVIPCTPLKKDRPASPDSSCPVNDNNNEFNSRSTFASPLPSQWNLNLSASAPLDVAVASQKNDSQPRRKFIICPSRLNRVELAKLSDICSICDGTISKEYTDEVTHLVIKLEKGRVPHTMKYLFAIADKKWIVVYDWVLECSMQGEMVPEEPYESSSFPECDSGVRKSRMNNTQLFLDITFYFPIVLKSSGATNEDCKKLVEKMGGTIVGGPFEVSPETGMIIVGESGIQSKQLYQGLYKSRGCLTVGWTWVLDCLLTYSLVPFSKSHLFTKLDGSGSIILPAPLINVNSYTSLSSHFNPSKNRTSPCN